MDETLYTKKIVGDALTFDDVLLVPALATFHPREADVSTQLTRGIRINMPLVSAPMDTVTESSLAIALAQEGGLGVIHRNLTIEQQTREVHKVKPPRAASSPTRPPCAPSTPSRTPAV